MSGLDEQEMPSCEWCNKSNIGWLIKTTDDNVALVINLSQTEAEKFGEYNMFLAKSPQRKEYMSKKKHIIDNFLEATCRECYASASNNALLLLKNAVSREIRRYPDVWIGRAI